MLQKSTLQAPSHKLTLTKLHVHSQSCPPALSPSQCNCLVNHYVTASNEAAAPQTQLQLEATTEQCSGPLLGLDPWAHAPQAVLGALAATANHYQSTVPAMSVSPVAVLSPPEAAAKPLPHHHVPRMFHACNSQVAERNVYTADPSRHASSTESRQEIICCTNFQPRRSLPRTTSS